MKNWLCMIGILSETHAVKPPKDTFGTGHLVFVERFVPFLEFSICQSLKPKRKTLRSLKCVNTVCSTHGCFNCEMARATLYMY